ncbi:MAG: AAA family ATPase [Shimia sp.]
MKDFADMAAHLADHRASAPRDRGDRLPTPFRWRDPAALPPRPWVYGRHLVRRQVSVTVAPGGVGKSSHSVVEALAMAAGNRLLGDWTAENLKVWLFNLEDERTELERRIIAAMAHHRIEPQAIQGRLFVDTGRERELTTAIQSREGFQILKPEYDHLAREIEARGIDVLIVDPFVSSHRVGENDNGAIDAVAKEWARLADRTNTAIELIHHTRKANGEVATTESARGATALLGAARSGRVFNRMTDAEKVEAGVQSDPATYFSITRDKSNLAPAGKREWRRMASVELPNGDSVGVAEAWAWPDLFDGITTADLLEVQKRIDGQQLRYSEQSGDRWAGHVVAEVLGLDGADDRKRVKKVIETWIRSKALVKVSVPDETRRPRPCLEVGEWVTS